MPLPTQQDTLDNRETRARRNFFDEVPEASLARAHIRDHRIFNEAMRERTTHETFTQALDRESLRMRGQVNHMQDEVVITNPWGLSERTGGSIHADNNSLLGELRWVHSILSNFPAPGDRTPQQQEEIMLALIEVSENNSNELPLTFN